MGIAKGRNISKAFLVLNICVYLLSRKKNIGEGNNSQSFPSLLEKNGYLGRKETLMILIPGAVCCCEENIKISSNFWPWVSIYRLESDIVQISLRSTSQITNYIYHIFLHESSYSIQWVSTVPDHSWNANWIHKRLRKWLFLVFGTTLEQLFTSMPFTYVSYLKMGRSCFFWCNDPLEMSLSLSLTSCVFALRELHSYF